MKLLIGILMLLLVVGSGCIDTAGKQEDDLEEFGFILCSSNGFEYKEYKRYVGPDYIHCLERPSYLPDGWDCSDDNCKLKIYDIDNAVWVS